MTKVSCKLIFNVFLSVPPSVKSRQERIEQSMTHDGFEISVVRPDPTEFWQQLWQMSHFVHWEKEPARWELLPEPVQGLFFSPKAIAVPSSKWHFCTHVKLSADTFLSSAAPGVMAVGGKVIFLGSLYAAAHLPLRSGGFSMYVVTLML